MSKDEWEKLKKEKGMAFIIPSAPRGRKIWELESVYRDKGTFKNQNGDVITWACYPCEMVEREDNG